MKKLENKVAVITGGTSGIGLAIATLFTSEGAIVVISSNSEKEGAEIANSISKDCIFVKADVREEKDVKNLFTQTISKCGHVDILVNSAGIYTLPQDDIRDISEEQFEDTMDVNVKGIFLTTKHFISEMIKTKGNIINIASMLGVVPEKGSAAYSASKAAVIMFTKTTALEFSKDVRINAICPGPIDTPMLRRGWPDKKEFQDYAKNTLLGRVGKPEEVAKLALFLGSVDAAYITGAAYLIDGGETLK